MYKATYNTVIESQTKYYNSDNIAIAVDRGLHGYCLCLFHISITQGRSYHSTNCAGKAESDVTTAITTEVTDYGIQYNVGNGLTLAAVGTQIEENTGGETSDVTTVSAKYNIASGLDAYLTYHDYDYEDGTSGTSADDDGSWTHVTIKASF